ncbi:hypothetical protein [Neptunicella sp.]|uniref:hypothetical protein n=1 Tax=Neptunicella sp. TaxID=2125986 RepID=UPI003F694619
MTKPLHIDAIDKNDRVVFTQAQRNSWVRAASKAGMKLNDWVTEACDAHVSVNHWPTVLPPHTTDEDFKTLPGDNWQQPDWCAGLTHRTAFCLVERGGYVSRQQIEYDFIHKPALHFLSIPNFGKKSLMELGQWLIN